MSAELDSTDEPYRGRTSPSAFPWLSPTFCPVKRGRPSRATPTPPTTPRQDEIGPVRARTRHQGARAKAATAWPRRAAPLRATRA